jgi:NAD(P)H-hydrate epimerase
VAAAGIEVAVNYPAALPPSPGKDKHKTFADVVFVAGAQNPADSTAFASMALVEMGGGLPRFVVPRSLVAPLEDLAGRTILVPQDETRSGTLALSALDEILDLGHSANLAILEPGRSPSNETQDLIGEFCRKLRRPLLVNGDVLAGGGEDLGVLRDRPDPTVLVLQPSELFRLVEAIGSGASTDPVPCTQALAKDLGAFVVLRGKPPLIGLPDGRVFIDLIDKFTGEYARGCNVLPGAIGAMWELGLSPEEAIRTALFIHGLAGEMVARNTGQPKPNARLIVEAIPSAIRMLRDTYASMMSGHQGAIEVI